MCANLWMELLTLIHKKIFLVGLPTYDQIDFRHTLSRDIINPDEMGAMQAPDTAKNVQEFQIRLGNSFYQIYKNATANATIGQLCFVRMYKLLF